MLTNAVKISTALGAMLLAAACNSDSSGFGGGGGGGGGTPSSVTSLGVTGEGGLTETLGLAALTDPLLGTEGILGGGGDGALGGVLPAELTDGLAPVADGLAPVVATLNDSLPLGMVTDQIPALGIGGEDGLVYDLVGQDPVGMLLGSNGTIPSLVGGGNDGALGDIIPAGAIPGLPGGGDGGVPGLDGLPIVGDLLGGLPVPGLPGGGDGGVGGLGVTGESGLVADLLGQDPVGPALAPLAPVADLIGGGNDGVLGDILPAGGLPGLPGGDGGGDSDPLAPLTGLLGSLPGLPGAQ